MPNVPGNASIHVLLSPAQVGALYGKDHLATMGVQRLCEVPSDTGAADGVWVSLGSVDASPLDSADGEDAT